MEGLSTPRFALQRGYDPRESRRREACRFSYSRSAGISHNIAQDRQGNLGHMPCTALPRVTGEEKIHVLGGLIVLLGVILTRVALDRAPRVPV
jgi:hypothetical protein